MGSRPHGWSPLTLLCVSSCSQDWVLHPGTSRPSPRTGFPLTVIQNPDLLVPELPLRAWGHPKTADGCWVARPSLLTRLDEGRVACLSKLQGQPHTVRVSGVHAEGQVHAVLPPRCQEPRGMGLPAAAAGCWASLSRVATAWHGRPAATPPTMLLWARGQGKLQARWARCPLSFVGVAQWSRWFRPPGCPRDPPLTFPLSPDPHRDVLRGAYARECSVGPAPVPQRGGSEGPGLGHKPTSHLPEADEAG